MPASMPCTTAGGMAWANRDSRVSPKTICRTPAPAVISVVTCQPKVLTSSATMTVRPAAGPETWSLEPPSRPATTAPTTAAMRPARIGAPEATAMPSERGTATRNTTIEAEKSARACGNVRPNQEPPGGECSPRPDSAGACSWSSTRCSVLLVGLVVLE